jgi:hypothetical protein
VQDFSRVYQMLDYVEKDDGPFSYVDPRCCLFGIGRESASLWFHLLHPFGNGGAKSYGRWLGLTDDQHSQLYHCLSSTISLVPEKSEEFKYGIDTDDKYSCIKAAREVLAHWEMEQTIDKTQEIVPVIERKTQQFLQLAARVDTITVLSEYED